MHDCMSQDFFLAKSIKSNFTPTKIEAAPTMTFLELLFADGKSISVDPAIRRPAKHFTVRKVFAVRVYKICSAESSFGTVNLFPGFI